MRKKTLALLLILIPLSWAARNYTPEQEDLVNLSSQWKRIEGVDSGSIRCIDIAPDGAVWMGWPGQVARFDGISYEYFGGDGKLDDVQNRIIKVTKSGDVYLIGATKIFRKRGEDWQLIGETDSRTNAVRAIEAADGSLWYPTQNQLVGIQGSHVYQSPQIGVQLQDLAIDAEGAFWLVSSNGDITRCRYENETPIIDRTWSGQLNAHSRKYARYARLHAARDGKIWAVNSTPEDPPIYIEPGSEQWTAIDLKSTEGTHRNYSLLEPIPGTLLISGNSSLSKWENGVVRTYERADLNLSFQDSILLDGGNGFIWIWERNISLFRVDYAGNRRKAYSGLIYQCDWGKGLNCFLSQEGEVVIQDMNTNRWTAYGTEDGVIDYPNSIICSKKGELWAAGTHGDSAAVSRFDGKTWERIPLPELGIRVSHQSALATDDGSLYFGSGHGVHFRPQIGGVLRFAPHQHGYRKEHILTDPKRVVGLHQNRQGKIIHAHRGLFALEEKGSHRIETPASLVFNWIDDFIINEDGRIWSANWGRGIVSFDTRESSSYTTENGLSSNYVSSLLRLSSGDILALTHAGIDRFDGQSWRPTGYPKAHAFREGSYLKESSRGTIWANFASRSWFFRNARQQDYIRSLRAVEYTPDRSPPETTVAIETIEDSYSNTIYAKFSGRDRWAETPDYQLQYSYRINDSEWSDFVDEKSIHLSGLSPGQHRFELKARDLEGNVDPSPARASFSIVVPFWQTRPFLYGVILLCIAVVVLAIALFAQRMKHVIEMDKARMRFLTNISHELRSPLALITWPLEKLAKHPKEKPDQSGLAMALRNAKRLNQLVEQLLDYRKAEAGEIIPNPKIGDLVQYLRLLISDFENLAHSHKQTVRMYCDETSYKTLFDEDILRKIIDNLIFNALKYSPDGANVSLSLKFGCIDDFGSDRARIIVEDNGIGIERDVQKHIFEPFYSGKKKLNNARSYGVGLAFVKELVDTLGGEISVLSPLYKRNGETKGTRFTIELPNLARLEEMQSGDASANIQREAPIPFPSQANAKEGDKNVVILLVDDHSELRSYVAKELADEYTIIQAENGKQALDLAIETIPDVILSDVVMPEMDGIRFCERLRAHKATSHIPVILQTSLASEENEHQGLDAGAVDYIQKPASLDVIKKRIHNHLENVRRYAEHLNAKLFAPQGESLNEERNPEVEFVNQVRDILHEKWDRFEFNVETLAEDLGMSKSSLYRKFKAIAQTSPAEIIMNYRMDRAAEMLTQGHLVSEVSEKIGYSEASPFNRAFKIRFGCTPTEYRKKARA
ncbi:MAG: hybrid sensor histidine kinase/response regulator transcription factor [Verrucomicrobiota bacterium]